VFEGVFDLGPCLFGVALELIGAPLGAQAGVAGGPTEELLGGALGPFELVGDLLTDAHCFSPMFDADSSFQGSQLGDLELPEMNWIGALSASAASLRCCRLSTPRPATEEGTPLPPRSGGGQFRIHPGASGRAGGLVFEVVVTVHKRRFPLGPLKFTAGVAPAARGALCTGQQHAHT